MRRRAWIGAGSVVAATLALHVPDWPRRALAEPPMAATAPAATAPATPDDKAAAPAVVSPGNGAAPAPSTPADPASGNPGVAIVPPIRRVAPPPPPKLTFVPPHVKGKPAPRSAKGVPGKAAKGVTAAVPAKAPSALGAPLATAGKAPCPVGKPFETKTKTCVAAAVRRAPARAAAAPSPPVAK